MKPSIEIEGVQPVIATGPKQGRPFKYPFNALRVGQAFWIPENRGSWGNIYVAVWRRNRAGGGQKFVLTTGEKNGKSGFRVQRIE